MNADLFYSQISPLRFRAIPGSLAQFHLEASECCLIHEDSPVTELDGVWLNPRGCMAYKIAAYHTVHGRRFWPPLSTHLKRIWLNRLRRWFTTDWVTRWKIRSKYRKWKSSSPLFNEDGLDCLIDETQILEKDGWSHV
jgi:hypothetical protein